MVFISNLYFTIITTNTAAAIFVLFIDKMKNWKRQILCHLDEH